MSLLYRVHIQEAGVSVEPALAKDWKRGYVLADPFKKTEFFGSVRGSAPAPAVNRTGVANDPNSFTRVKLSRERQFFWADLLSLKKFRTLYWECTQDQKNYVGSRLGALMGPQLAFTNRPEGSLVINYVTGENPDEGEASFAPLVCAGNTVWYSLAGSGTWNGFQTVKLFSFLPGEPLPSPSLSLLEDPRVLWATIIRQDGSVGPFPQLEGESVPYPYFTAQPYFYPLGDMADYPFTDPVRSQYTPAREYYP